MTTFDFSLPTRIVFGAGRAAECGTFIPAGPGPVVLVRGRSGHASGQIAASLRNSDVIEVICASEPILPELETQLAKLRPLHQVWRHQL